jgi:uncharacterized protein (DUF983 family)
MPRPRSRFARVRLALGRGLRRRCPHCGQGRIFRTWAETLERCPVCGLVYERNAGDTWAFTILGDRLPVGLAVAAVYFGLFRRSTAAGLVGLVIVTAVVIWTAPNRWGAGIALHYLSRSVWPDPDDPIPPSPPNPPSD